jgi:hypothetical protein
MQGILKRSRDPLRSKPCRRCSRDSQEEKTVVPRRGGKMVTRLQELVRDRDGNPEGLNVKGTESEPTSGLPPQPHPARS